MLSFRGASAVKVKFEITAKIEGRKNPGTLSLDWKRSTSKGKFGKASFQNNVFSWKDKIDFDLKLFNDKKDGFPQKLIFFTVFEKVDGKKQTQYKTSLDLSKFVPQEKSVLPVLSDHLAPKPEDGSTLKITVSAKILKVKSRKSKYAQNSNGDFDETEDSGEWSFSEAGSASGSAEESSSESESSSSSSSKPKKTKLSLTGNSGSKDKLTKSGGSKEGGLFSRRMKKSLSSSGSESEKSGKKALPAPEQDKVPLWKLEKLDNEAFKYGEMFLQACANWLKTHEGLTTVGIFRKAGEEPKIIALRKLTGAGEFNFSDDEDPNVIASLMKRYLREMKEPLLTFDLYEKFIDIAGLPVKELDAEILKLITSIPENNQKLLNFLCQFFYEVSLHSEVNLMTTTNLSIVVGPNILRPRVETHETLLNNSVQVGVIVEALISRIVPGLNKRQSIQAQEAIEFLNSIKTSSEEASILETIPIAEQTPQQQMLPETPPAVDQKPQETPLNVPAEPSPKSPRAAIGPLRTSGAHPSPRFISTEGSEKNPRESAQRRSRSNSTSRDKKSDSDTEAPAEHVSTPTRQRTSSRAQELGFDFDVKDLKTAERNLRRSGARPTPRRESQSQTPEQSTPTEPASPAPETVDLEKQKLERQLEYCNSAKDRALQAPGKPKELVILDLTKPKTNMFDDEALVKAEVKSILDSVSDVPEQPEEPIQPKKKFAQYAPLEDEPRPSQQDIQKKYQQQQQTNTAFERPELPAFTPSPSTGGGKKYEKLEEDQPLVDGDDKKGCCSCACSIQ